VASWPTQTNLPAVLLAIEFASPEEAQKFEPQLRRFMPTLAATPEPTPAPHTGQPLTVSTPSVQPQPSASASFPYHIAHTGSLVLLSDKAFAFRDLKPRQAKLLAEDQNFVTARNRFASESLFLYVDVKAIEKEEQDRRKKYEEENQRMVEKELHRVKEEQATTPEIAEPTVVEAIPMLTTDAPPQPDDVNETASLSASAQVQAPTGTPGGEERALDSTLMTTLTYSIYGGLFNGLPKWPEAVAAAVAFEGDAYVLRALVLNSAENKAVAVPFLPQLVSGPALIPASPAVLPADADLFISASLEYPQMYDGLLRSFAGMNDRARKYSIQVVNAPAVSPFAEFEKKLGLKIRDDILPLLGNELGIALVPKSAEGDSANPSATPAADIQQKVKTYDPDPIVAVAVKDKDAVRLLIPKLIEAMGFKGASLIAQTERKDDTETTNYANLFTYAFVGDFLILSPNPAAVKGAVASYLSGETLAANSYFRNASRWQSRQVQAQVYLAPGLVQRYGLGGGNSVNERTAELLSHLNLPIEPLTYSLSNEGSGPLHELHFPKNLLLLMIASLSKDANAAPLKANEAAVKNELRTIVGAEATYQATTGDGRYGTIDELVKAGLLSKEPMERYGYQIELTVSANKFQATAMPLEYRKSGNLSYFIDETGVLRGGDHGGGPAAIADPPN
jgi:hypothetical protein